MSASTSPPVTKAVVLVETTAKDVSTTEPYRVLSRSKACGTAFRVRRDLFPKAEWNRETVQLYLSNYHVIEGAEDKRVRMRVASSPEYTSGRVVHCVPALDFALIAVNMEENREEDILDPFCSAPSSVLAGVQPVELHVGEVIPSAQKILACGFPMGYLEQFISRGTLAGRQSCGDATTDYFSCDLSLNSGNSGGPCVFDGGPCDGQAFAISTATEQGDALQISYAVPISVVLQWLSNYYTGQVLGVFPRWSFALCSRTDAFDEEHKFPSNLDGAIVCNVGKECKYDIKKGDVLVSINRGGVINKLDRFGLLSDIYHGDPKFSIMNRGYLAGCNPKSTSVTVWRPSIKVPYVPLRPRASSENRDPPPGVQSASLRSARIVRHHERYGGFPSGRHGRRQRRRGRRRGARPGLSHSSENSREQGEDGHSAQPLPLQFVCQQHQND